MLVLSRKQGQTIEFPEQEIVVRVISVKRCRVQLGIEAPERITVHRGERARELAARGELPEPRCSESSDLFTRAEANRVLDELVRLEAEVSALAELVDADNREIGQSVANNALQRIEGIGRSVKMKLRQRAELQPIADLVRIRAEVLDRLRERNLPAPVECVAD
ncbi:MAG: carbon storage regulator [Planctomycetota bacterium]